MKDGYLIRSFPMPEGIEKYVREKNWELVDRAFEKLNSPGGAIFNLLQEYQTFAHIEQMISVRDSANPWEEDGIWHDDGSRVLAYSLSLTFHPEELEGGKLGLRRKNQEAFVEIETPRFGDAIVFLTGVHGFEHRIHQVKKGQRSILVGWCSL